MVCGPVPIHDLCVSVRNKYRNFKKARNVYPSDIAVTSTLRMGGILNRPETSLSVALAGGGAPG